MSINDPKTKEYCWELYKFHIRPLYTYWAEWDNKTQENWFYADLFNENLAKPIMSNDDVVGWYQLAEDKHSIEIEQLFIDPNFTGQGLGTDIIKSLIDLCAKTSKKLHLDVLKNNLKAIALYERLGFVVDRTSEKKLFMVYNGT